MKRFRLITILLLPSIFATFILWCSYIAASFAVAPVDVSSEGLNVNDLLNQGLDQFDQGQYDLAIASWQRAYALYKQPHSHSVLLLYIGLAFNRLGNYSTALQHLEQALTIIQAVAEPAPDTESEILSTLAETYNEIGNYAEAINFYEDSLELARSLEDRTEEARILNNLGLVYFRAEETGQAIEAYQHSLDIGETLVAHMMTGQPIQSMAREQIQMLSQTLSTMGYTYHNLGIASAMQTMYSGNFTRAIDHYSRSLAIAQKLENHQRLIGAVHRSLGSVYDESNDFSKAIDAHSQSIRVFQSINEPRELARSYNNRAHAYLEWAKSARVVGSESSAMDKLQQAQRDLEVAVATLTVLRETLTIDNQRISIFDTQVMTYNLLQQVLIAQDQPEKALEVSEEGRSQALSILLKDKQTPSSRPFNLAQIKQFAQEQNATLVEYSIVPEDNIVHQGKARGKAAELYIWVVQPSGNVVFRQVNLQGQNIDLAKTVRLSLETIGVRSRGSLVAVEPVEADHTEQLRTLYQILIEPIADFLPKSSTEPVIFIPQNELFLVPFPALLDADNIHLIRNHTVISAPSIQVLQLAQRRQETSTLGVATSDVDSLSAKDFLIVGNPEMPTVWNPTSASQQSLTNLPGAETEALAVAKLFDSEPLINEQATEQRVKQRIADATVVHLATHGLLEYGNPQDSGIQDTPGAIALTPDADNDGLLTAAEIAELELTADLVVLSACDTGLGQITGDGVIGLSRSFLQAGAANVMVSLWSVPDAPTADLMTEFYRQLRQGEGKAQALRQAMLDTLATHPDPEDWAAFTLIGSVD